MFTQFQLINLCIILLFNYIYRERVTMVLSHAYSAWRNTRVLIWAREKRWDIYKFIFANKYNYFCVCVNKYYYLFKKNYKHLKKIKKKCNYNKWWLWTRVSAISENYMSKVCVILITITIIFFIKCFKSFFDLSFESKNNVRNTNYFTKYFINCWYGEWLLINEKKWY